MLNEIEAPSCREGNLDDKNYAGSEELFSFEEGTDLNIDDVINDTAFSVNLDNAMR